MVTTRPPKTIVKPTALLLTSLCRWQSHPAQYVSGIPSAVILLSISHPIRCSTRCLANVRVRISGRRCCTALAESEIRLWWWPRYVRA